MADLIEYIVTTRHGIDMSNYNDKGVRIPRRAKKGDVVKITEERAKSLVNLVVSVESVEKKKDADAKVAKAKAEKAALFKKTVEKSTAKAASKSSKANAGGQS